MRILDSDNYINEKLNIAPVTKSRLSNIKETSVIATDETIFDLVRNTIEKYGDDADLNFIQTYKVTNMSNLFMHHTFNGDISKWDVHNVTDMSCMFQTSDFNGDISKWNVSNVRDMSFMFNQSAFNNDISDWDVSSVTDMGYMFRKSVFNGDISNWNVVLNNTDTTHIFDGSPLENREPAWY